MRATVVVMAVLAGSVVGCATPEQKATSTLAGRWKGSVQIVGAPPVDVRLTFQKGGTYTESRTIAGFPGFTGGGAWGIRGAQLTFSPTTAPPPNPGPAAARALMPVTGTQTLTIYNENRVRIGDLDFAREGG